MKLGTKTIALPALVPVVITLLLLLWTLVVYPYSRYGDRWALWPALISLPVVIAVHVFLIVRYRPRWGYYLYAAIHAVVFVPHWFGCLMLISKDSL
jgi:hypothetical protein